MTQNGYKGFEDFLQKDGKNKQSSLAENTESTFEKPPEIRYITSSTPEQPNPYLLAAFQVSLLVGGMGGLYYFLNRRNQRASSENESKIHSPVNDISELPALRLVDVGGIGDIREDVSDFIGPIKEFINGEDVSFNRCLLLSGPTGVGKTRLARAIAGELQVPYFEINSGSLATHIYVGDGLKRIENQVNKAREKVQKFEEFLRKQNGATGKEKGIVVVFIDEFDSIGKKRSESRGSDEDNKVTNLLLSITDKTNPQYSRLIIIGATNNPNVIDDALKRPGRFQEIVMEAPRNIVQRLEVIEALIKENVMTQGLDVEPDAIRWLARVGESLSGAQICGILENAVRSIKKEERKLIQVADLADGYFKLQGGNLRKGGYTEEDQVHVMAHEIGHAVLRYLTGATIEFISCIPRKNWLGVVGSTKPEESKTLNTFNGLMGSCISVLGGRAAERVVYPLGEISDGASADFELARNLSKHLLKMALVGHNFDVEDLSDRHYRLLNKAVQKCEEVAVTVLEALGKEWIVEEAQKCVREQKELIGTEAHEYIASILGDRYDELRELFQSKLEELAASEIGPNGESLQAKSQNASTSSGGHWS